MDNKEKGTAKEAERLHGTVVAVWKSAGGIIRQLPTVKGQPGIQFSLKDIIEGVPLVGARCRFIKDTTGLKAVAKNVTIENQAFQSQEDLINHLVGTVRVARVNSWKDANGHGEGYAYAILVPWPRGQRVSVHIPESSIVTGGHIKVGSKVRVKIAPPTPPLKFLTSVETEIYMPETEMEPEKVEYPENLSPNEARAVTRGSDNSALALVGQVRDFYVVSWSGSAGFARVSGGGRRAGIYFSVNSVITMGEETLKVGSRIRARVAESSPGRLRPHLSEIELYCPEPPAPALDSEQEQNSEEVEENI